MAKITPLLKTVILTAPQGWGKTRNAEALQKEFGCRAVVDEWNHSQPLTSGALHLTNESPHSFRNNKPEIFQLVSRGWN
ncbi:MAG: hypothetical protein Q7K57_51780 [Burkholderiaceae bacterium]|nr:hypothetical protein [Burkholderiaceae bacterium]